MTSLSSFTIYVSVRKKKMWNGVLSSSEERKSLFNYLSLRAGKKATIITTNQSFIHPLKITKSTFYLNKTNIFAISFKWINYEKSNIFLFDVFCAILFNSSTLLAKVADSKDIEIRVRKMDESRRNVLPVPPWLDKTSVYITFLNSPKQVRIMVFDSDSMVVEKKWSPI